SHTFVIFDRSGNFIENKNLSNEYDDWTGNQLKEELRQEGFIVDSKSNIDNYYNSPFTDVSVIAPKHILTLNYVDQNGKTLYVEKHAVTNYGQTDVQKNLSDNYTVDNDQKSVNNSNTNYTVKVTAKDGINDSFQQKENDIFTDTPAVNEVSSSNDLSTQSGNSYTYNANITIQDQTGKRLGSYVLSNEDSNIVSFDEIIENYNKDYDTSGLPKYVDLTQGNQIFTVNSHNVDDDNKPIGNNDKVVFKIIDQHGNFVEYLTFNTYGKKLKTIELADRLKQEKMILHNNPALSNEYVPDGTYNMDVNVIAPYQIDKVNYINQDNQLIFSSYHLASSKDFKIDVSNDLYRMPRGTILDLDDNNYIDNKPEQNVYVTEDLKQTPYQKMSDLTLNYDSFSQVNPVSIDYLDSDDTSGITYLGYSAIIILKNQYGKIVRADRIDGYQWNLVKFDYLSDENKADYDLSSLPEYIDLSLGMQTFVIKSLKPYNTSTDID
ncbi:hypothetical protein M9195_06645, partial [Apilactobacillus sp. F1]|nr:hypothetical protein [Apilactobacillus sp. F1]